MSGSEEAITFVVGGDQLAGILHRADTPYRRGVLIVVGGPQYRVGSHRQFVLLARYLKDQGIAALRFDYRGMGDCDGPQVTFEQTGDDIRCAIDALFSRVPELTEVVIWGLCDAAAAALIYARNDARVTGLILVNPWVRSADTMARTVLTHHYRSRLGDIESWKRVVTGKVDIINTLRALIGNALQSFRRPTSRSHEGNEGGPDFVERMLRGLDAFNGQVLFILSGDDLTAAEFTTLVSGSRRWKRLLRRPVVETQNFPAANHTFSCAAWRDKVALWSGDWIKSW